MHIEKVRQTYMEKYFLDAAREKGYPIHDTNARQSQGKELHKLRNYFLGYIRLINCPKLHIGFGEMDVTHYNGFRWSTYPGYIEPILKRRNLRIYRYARVIKVRNKDKARMYKIEVPLTGAGKGMHLFYSISSPELVVTV